MGDNFVNDLSIQGVKANYDKKEKHDAEVVDKNDKECQDIENGDDCKQQCRNCGCFEEESLIFLTCAKCLNDTTLLPKDRMIYCSRYCCKEDWTKQHKLEHAKRK